MHTLTQHKRLGVAAIAAVILNMSAIDATQARETTEQATHRTWTVDMRGRPPYKRRLVETPANIDLATLETTSIDSAETVTVWERSSGGHPPFARKRVEMPVVDAASMEILSPQQKGTVFRGRPPFKRHQ